MSARVAGSLRSRAYIAAAAASQREKSVSVHFARPSAIARSRTTRAMLGSFSTSNNHPRSRRSAASMQPRGSPCRSRISLHLSSSAHAWRYAVSARAASGGRLWPASARSPRRMHESSAPAPSLQRAAHASTSWHPAGGLIAGSGFAATFAGSSAGFAGVPAVGGVGGVPAGGGPAGGVPAGGGVPVGGVPGGVPVGGFGGVPVGGVPAGGVGGVPAGGVP